MNVYSKTHVVTLEADTLALRFTNPLTNSPVTPTKRLIANHLSDWAWKTQLRRGSVGLLELNIEMQQSRLAERIKLVRQLSRENQAQFLLIAVTDNEMSQFTKQLLISGFARVFCSHVETTKLEQTIARHRQRIAWPSLPYKDVVEANLPWK